MGPKERDLLLPAEERDEEKEGNGGERELGLARGN